ncbi:MAG: glycosyltransferase family 4 protein [bacterium]|nr:glycosyltransferase family 4 protein [bacterium]
MSQRIAYLTGEYPRGTDTFISREVMALRKRGLEIETFSIRRAAGNLKLGRDQQAELERTFFVLEQSPGSIVSDVLGILWKSPSRFWKAMRLALSTAAPGLRALAYQLFYLAEACVIARQLEIRGLTHIHNQFADSSCTVAMLAAEISGSRFSFTIHGPGIFFEPKLWRIDAKAERARFVACISHFCRSQTMAHCAPSSWDHLHIVHCGIDLDDFVARTHVGIATRLLFVGRLAPIKGLSVLIEAFSRLAAEHPEISLDIVGDGPSRAEIEQLIADRGFSERIRLLGYRSEEEVGELLKEAEIFVMASFAEGVPVVLMEAMAAGVPCLATRVAGIPELIEDGKSGLLAAPGDVEALVSHLRELIVQPELRTRLAAAGRTKVEREFDLHREAEWLARLISEDPRDEDCPIRPAPVDESEAGLKTR